MLEQVRKWIMTVAVLGLAIAALLAVLQPSHEAHASGDQAGETSSVNCAMMGWKNAEVAEASLKELHAAGARDFVVFLSSAKYIACGW